MKLTQCFHLMMDVKIDKAALPLHRMALQLRFIAAGELFIICFPRRTVQDESMAAHSSRNMDRPIMIRVSSRRNWKERYGHGFCRNKSV